MFQAQEQESASNDTQAHQKTQLLSMFLHAEPTVPTLAVSDCSTVAAPTVILHPLPAARDPASLSNGIEGEPSQWSTGLFSGLCADPGGCHACAFGLIAPSLLFSVIAEHEDEREVSCVPLPLNLVLSFDMSEAWEPMQPTQMCSHTRFPISTASTRRRPVWGCLLQPLSPRWLLHMGLRVPLLLPLAVFRDPRRPHGHPHSNQVARILPLLTPSSSPVVQVSLPFAVSCRPCREAKGWDAILSETCAMWLNRSFLPAGSAGASLGPSWATASQCTSARRAL